MKETIYVFILLPIGLSFNLDISHAQTSTDKKIKYEIVLEDGNVKYESDLNDQNYSYRSETEDGQIKYESGHFEDGNLVVEGGYEYIGDNGLTYSVTYVADKNGYRPKVSFGTKIAFPPSVIRTTPQPPRYPTCLPPQQTTIRPYIRPATQPAPAYYPSPAISYSPVPRIYIEPRTTRFPPQPTMISNDLDPVVKESLAGSGVHDFTDGSMNKIRRSTLSMFQVILNTNRSY